MKFALFATLALSPACAVNVADDERAAAAQTSKLAPLPKPTRLDPTEPSEFCPWNLALITNTRVIFDGTAPLRQPAEPGVDERVDIYSGTVKELEHSIPAKAAKDLQIEASQDAFRSATIDVEGHTLRLAAKTRSLGLREGMSIEARETRTGSFSDSRYRLTIQTGDTIVFQHEGARWVEDVELPDGLRVERADFWCDWGADSRLRGELASLRFTNRAGKRIVLLPGEVGSLGDFDIYVWNTLGPPGNMRISLGGIDAEPAMIQLAVVRR